MSTRYKFHPYSQEDIDSLKGIALPTKLKCGRCLKNLPQAKFSAKQLNDARRQIKESSQIKNSINCQACTGQKVVEVECTMCGKTKGLEDFAKSQRRNPDTAKCFKCVERQISQDAVNTDKYEDPDKAFVTPDHSNGQYPEYFSAAATDASSAYGEDDWKSVNENYTPKRKGDRDGGVALSADFQRIMSLTGSVDENLIDSEYAYPAGYGRNSNSNDGWSEVHTKSWHTQSNGGTSTPSILKSNACGRSGASATSSSQSFTSNTTERSTISGARPKAWAKIPAAPRGPPIRPMGDAARETGPVVDAWTDSDNDEEEEDSDDEPNDDTVI